MGAAAAESKPPIEAVATQIAEAAAPEARSQDLLAHHWMPPTDCVSGEQQGNDAETPSRMGVDHGN